MPDGLAVVVPVLNEADNLPDLLDDLARQELTPDEVIVVDAGSSDGTRELAERRAASWAKLRVARLDGALPGHARNEGIRRSRSALIATLDAGSRVGPGWLDALSGPMRSGGRARVCVGVAVADPHSAFERAAGWFTLRAFKPASGRPPLSPSFRPAGRNGLCFGRGSWERAGGYPEDLRWAEDKVFLERLRHAGVEVSPVPGAIVAWRPRRSLGELFRQYEGYGRGDALAGIDRQNEMITLALYGSAAVLSVLSLAGSAPALFALGTAAIAYPGLFTVAALRQLGFDPALAWVPPIRLSADLGKMRGFIGAYASRWKRFR